jgi:hypothetical protein
LVVSAYQFPNPDRTLVSNALHNVGLVLLTRYRFNYRFPSAWLSEGFAYHLELETLGYSESFTIGRSSVAGTGEAGGGTTEGERPAWSESGKWPAALQQLVTAGTDPPLRRLAEMTQDQMGYEELVKSWSVVTFLVQWDAARFKQFVDGSKKRDAVEEEALQAAYGADFREVDRKWRAWVAAGFKGP